MPLSGELNCHQTCVNSGSLMSKSSFMPELRSKGVVRSRTILLVSRLSESSGRVLPLDLSRKIESMASVSWRCGKNRKLETEISEA